MLIRDESLRTIVSRAESFTEYILRTHQESSPEIFDSFVQSQASAATAQNIAGGTRDDSIPEWARLLQTVLYKYSAEQENSSLSNFAVESPSDYPFQDILLPFVRFFRSELEAVAGSSIELLATSARCSLERHLLRSLSHLALLPLYLTYRLFINDLDHPNNIDSKLEPNYHYIRFVRQFLTSDCEAFFSEYSVLGKLLSISTQNAVKSARELVCRLSTDIDRLHRHFTPSLKTVVAINAGLSDPHFGGRSVASLTFNDGTRIIYKPKPLASEQGFSALLIWLNNRSANSSLRPLRVLDCGEYGWVEAISACTSATDRSHSYFFNTGRLLCLAYLLRANDFHHENVMDSPDHPVMIDLETLCTTARRVNDSDRTPLLQRHVLSASHSVMSTGLLPVWLEGGDGASYDISGLSASNYVSEFPWYSVRAINTDAMTVAFSRHQVTLRAAGTASNAIVTVDSQSRSEFMAGFLAAYDVIQPYRTRLLRSEALQWLRGVTLRYVFRPSRLYGRLIQRLTQPACLRTGPRFSSELSILLEVLRRPLDPEDSMPLQQIVFAELEALEQLDLPHFSHIPSSRHLFVGSRIICQDYFGESAIHQVEERLRRMSDSDKLVQARLAEMCMYARFESDSTASRPAPQALDIVQNEIHETCITFARLIGDALCESAIMLSDGVCTWVSLGNDTTNKRTTANLADLTLYDGQTGTALFLFALFAETGVQKYYDVARAAITPLVKCLEGDTKAIWNSSGFGFAGTGGVLAGLETLNSFHECKLTRSLANEIAERALQIQVESDQIYDIMSGSAGAIITLSSFLSANRNRPLEVVIERLANHVLNARSRAASGQLVWRTSKQEPALNGLAHGSSGIGFSLLVAHQITRDSRQIEAYMEALEFETATLSDDGRSWKDLRRDASREPNCSWCHGAVGIGLNRLAAISRFGINAAKDDLERAISFVTLDARERSDGLCCGEAGCIDFLLETGTTLDRPDLVNAAASRMKQLVQRFCQNRSFRLFTGLTPPGLHTGFFQGAPGIGYLALRFCDARRYPTMLLGGTFRASATSGYRP